jgi:Copine/C2 domain
MINWDSDASINEIDNPVLPENLSTTLKLRLHAKSLPLVGLTKRRPDCWCVVSVVDRLPNLSFDGPSTEKSLGETEIIPKSCRPQWTKPLWLDYEHGTKKYFHVNVLRHSNTQGHKVVGSALFEVSDVLASNSCKVKRFPQGGVVIAHLRIVPSAREDCVFRFRLRTMQLKIPRTVFGTKVDDTIFELARKSITKVGHSWIVIYRSNPVLDSVLPCWDDAEVSLETGSDEELLCPVQLLVWDKTRRIFLGCVETSVHNIVGSLVEGDFDEPSERDLVLLKRGKEVGSLRVIKASIVTAKQIEEEEVELDRLNNATAELEEPDILRLSAIALTVSPSKKDRFTHYIKEGCEIDCYFAVDFTSSNGDPRTPESNHYILDNESHNDYQEVIQVVGSALIQYSTTNKCSLWGFGAKFGGEARHIFQCGPTPTVNGVEGIQDAYRSMFENELVMSGPTCYDSVIQAAAMRSRNYHVRLNGWIHILSLANLTSNTETLRI